MTLDLLDWDEDLPADAEEEYQGLLNGLTRSQGFGLFFVQCSSFSREKLIERVKADLNPKRLQVLTFDHPIVGGNVFKQVKAVLHQRPTDVLLIQGLEYSLADATETKTRLGWSDDKVDTSNWRDTPAVLVNLNQQRERFRDTFSTCLVFVLPQYAIKYMAHRAPDFFDWRSGFFKYASDPITLAYESARILREADYDAYCRWSPEERSRRLLEIQDLLDAHQDIEPQANLCFEQGLIFQVSRWPQIIVVFLGC